MRRCASTPSALCLLGGFLLAAAAGPPAAAQQAAPRIPALIDVTDESGIEFRNHYGSAEKRWPTEFGGSGGGWIDFDVDGRADLILVNALDGPGNDPVGATLRGLAGSGGGAGRGGDAGSGGAAGDDDLGHRLFRRTNDGFVKLDGVGIEDRVWGNGVAVGDVDNDGFPDVYVTAIGPNRLYRNQGDGTFRAWEAGVEDPRWSTSAAFTDWNGDGHLDLYVVNYIDFDPATTAGQGDGVCNYRGIDVFCGPEGLRGATDGLFLNRGDGTFEEVVEPPIDPEATYGFALVATDCDADGLPEVFVAADSTMNLLYGRSGGTIDDLSLFSGAGYSGAGREQAGMGATAADFDGDGDTDLYVTNFTNDYNTLYRNLGDCLFEDVSEPLGLGRSSLPFMGWAPLFIDIDGDADEDLFVANGHIYPQLDAAGLEPYAQRNLLYRNLLREEGKARFEEIGEQSGAGLGMVASSRGAASADYDNDFDSDLLVTTIDGSPALLRNDTAASYPALRLRLIGRASNRSAYGARLSIESGGIRQVRELRASDGYLGSNDTRPLFFLPGGVADSVVIDWGEGSTTRLEAVAPGSIIIDETHGVIARRDR